MVQEKNKKLKIYILFLKTNLGTWEFWIFPKGICKHSNFVQCRHKCLLLSDLSQSNLDSMFLSSYYFD